MELVITPGCGLWDWEKGLEADWAQVLGWLSPFQTY